MSGCRFLPLLLLCWLCVLSENLFVRRLGEMLYGFGGEAEKVKDFRELTEVSLNCVVRC